MIPANSAARKGVLSEEDREILLDVAEAAIAAGFGAGPALELDPRAYRSHLQDPAAAFVTLRVEGSLRGCVGTIDAKEALLCSVARNAFGAAFFDLRFPPLSRQEFENLQITISILSTPERLECRSEEELLRQLGPHRDGLVLRSGAVMAIFLPAVWETLQDPPDFLRHLRLKAGLKPDGWSEDLRFERFTVEELTRSRRKLRRA